MISDFFAYFLIPAYTILFSAGQNMFTTNFSVIGSAEHIQQTFVLWGILVGSFFYFQVRKIILASGGTSLEYHLLNAALVLLLMAIITPYLPNISPFPSFLHVIFAFCSSVVLMLCLILIIRRLYRTAPYEFAIFLYSLIAIITISAILFLIAGIICSAMEIFYTISLCVLVRKLKKRVETRLFFHRHV